MEDQRVEMSVEEAAKVGIGFLMLGQLDDAATLFEKLLSVRPDQPEALHYSGVIMHKRGESDEALRRVRRSLVVAPDQADWHSNLGILLEGMGDGEGAIAAFEQAIALNPRHTNAHNNLGVLHRAFDRYDEAEAAYRRVIAIDPEHPEVYRNLAIVLDQTGRTHEALVAYCKAMTLRPNLPETRRLLAVAYTTIGDTAKAIRTCEEWVRDEPDDPVARHTLAAVKGEAVPNRASDEFIVKSFDGFAETFEAKLKRLEYRAPALIEAALAETGRTAAGVAEVLDAGCGTGWCGGFLKPYAATLTGVDLSSGMLEHARQKGVYDDLVQAELVEYLEAHPDGFDVVVSADTLVYFGVLDRFVAALAAALRPGGHALFTLEAAGEGTETYHLEVHGRYNHAESYVRRLLEDAGLTPVIGRAVLRNESGLPVHGLVVRADKSMGGARG
ncbi:MAG TPA: tetratricopeptide repeat protein [Luteitalea sp.]|nr:tetratricopeptide repeat protein [Luteitalea sp.]